MRSKHNYRDEDVGNNIEKLLFWLCAVMLCFAPLMRSGKMYFAELVLELAGVLLLILAFWNSPEKRRIPLLAWLLMSTGVLIPLLYLVPLPLSLWQAIPGRGLYAEVINALANNGVQAEHLSLSLVPYRTVSSLLALIPVISVFIAALLLPRKRLTMLTYVFLGVAAFQAALGLIQYGSSADWAFWFGISHGNKNALGTYANYDHFACLMELTIPLALALLAYNTHNPYHNHESGQHIFNQTLVFFSLVLLLVLGAVFSRSRMGITLVMLGILLSSIVFARHIGGRQHLGLSGVLGTIALGITSSIGLVPVLNRFSRDPSEDVRWEIFANTWIGIKQFFPFGSGPGTFQPIFYSFQPPELQGFVNHAHNDYLELLFEIGIFGIIPLLLFIVLYMQGWVGLRGHRWNQFHFIQTAAGISLLLMSLHGLVDFNFHTPANAIFFAFLSGIFLHRSLQKNTSSQIDRKH